MEPTASAPTAAGSPSFPAIIPTLYLTDDSAKPFLTDHGRATGRTSLIRLSVKTDSSARDSRPLRPPAALLEHKGRTTLITDILCASRRIREPVIKSDTEKDVYARRQPRPAGRVPGHHALTETGCSCPRSNQTVNRAMEPAPSRPSMGALAHRPGGSPAPSCRRQPEAVSELARETGLSMVPTDSHARQAFPIRRGDGLPASRGQGEAP